MVATAPADRASECPRPPAGIRASRTSSRARAYEPAPGADADALERTRGTSGTGGGGPRLPARGLRADGLAALRPPAGRPRGRRLRRRRADRRAPRRAQQPADPRRRPAAPARRACTGWCSRGGRRSWPASTRRPAATARATRPRRSWPCVAAHRPEVEARCWHAACRPTRSAGRRCWRRASRWSPAAAACRCVCGRSGARPDCSCAGTATGTPPAGSSSGMRPARWSFDDVWLPPAPDLSGPVTRRPIAGAATSRPSTPPREDGRLTLLSFVWPDQAARFDRLRTRARIAARRPGRPIDRADAGDWVEEQVRPTPRGRARPTVVFHSIVLQYLPRESRPAHAQRRAARRRRRGATAEAPLRWLRMEPAGAESRPPPHLVARRRGGGAGHLRLPRRRHPLECRLTVGAGHPSAADIVSIAVVRSRTTIPTWWNRSARRHSSVVIVPTPARLTAI